MTSIALATLTCYLLSAPTQLIVGYVRVDAVEAETHLRPAEGIRRVGCV